MEAWPIVSVVLAALAVASPVGAQSCGGERAAPLHVANGVRNWIAPDIVLYVVSRGRDTVKIVPRTGMTTPMAHESPLPGASCGDCGEGTTNVLDLAGGARVERIVGKTMYRRQAILLTLPGREPRVLARSAPTPPTRPGEEEIIASCAPEPSELVGTLAGGRYLLYRIEDVYWLYGVAADRSAAVWRGYGSIRW